MMFSAATKGGQGVVQQLTPEYLKLLSTTFAQPVHHQVPTIFNPMFGTPHFGQVPSSFDPRGLGFQFQGMQQVPQMFPVFSNLSNPLMNMVRPNDLKPMCFAVMPAVQPVLANSVAPEAKTESRKRKTSLDDDDTASASSSGTPSDRAAKRERLEPKASSDDANNEMGLGGESRLKINFSNQGNPGKHPQVFGKSRLGVPNELSGTYVLYSERWRSEILHENESFESEDGTKHVLITWKITNLTSGVTQSRTETPKEALLRHKDGRTLCNKVFRRALEQRAQDLENDLRTETNAIRIKTMKNLIKKLRPKHFSEGPLVFGLRHESVQNRFKSMISLDSNGHLVTKVDAQVA